MTEPVALPPESRYGRRRVTATSRKRVGIALGVLVVAFGVVLAVIGYQRFATQAVEGKIDSYQVLDDQTVSVTINVTREDPSRPVSCIVRARSHDGAETGRREVLIPPSDSTAVQVRTTVKSYKRPFVGDIYGCGVSVPGYLVGP